MTSGAGACASCRSTRLRRASDRTGSRSSQRRSAAAPSAAAGWCRATTWADMAGPIRKVVVGADGSSQSAAALEWAANMARGMGSEVIAVYAVDIPVYAYGAEPGAVPPPQFDPEWRAQLKREFEKQWVEPLKEAGVKYRTVMEDGKAA